MPEASQFTLNHRELMELIVKSAGVHEGKWMLLLNFNFTAANIGSGPEDALPSALVQVANVGITKARDDAPASLVIDAAVVNPAPKATMTAKKKT